MRDANYEARRERLEREREAGIAFQAVLREKLEAKTPRLEDLMEQGETGDDA